MGMATVKYELGVYSGKIDVFCEENDDNETIIAQAKRELRRRAGPLPAGPMYESWKIIARDGGCLE